MANATDYIARMRDLATTCDDVARFYLFLDDEQLYDMEMAMLEDGTAIELLPVVSNLYLEWRREMGEEQWQQLLAENEALGDGDRNWLIPELDAPMETGGEEIPACAVQTGDTA